MQDAVGAVDEDEEVVVACRHILQIQVELSLRGRDWMLRSAHIGTSEGTGDAPFMASSISPSCERRAISTSKPYTPSSRPFSHCTRFAFPFTHCVAFCGCDITKYDAGDRISWASGWPATVLTRDLCREAG